MADEWIKVRENLPEDPAVDGIATQLQISQDEAIGLLVRFWIWAPKYTTTGRIGCVSAKCPQNVRTVSADCLMVDRIVGVPGFAEAMLQVGWLEKDGGFLTIPRFDRHMSKSAKRRALDAERKRNIRAGADEKTSSKRPLSKRTKRGPEKRREEKKQTTPCSPPKPKPDDWAQVQPLVAGTDLDCERFRVVWEGWAKDRRDRGSKLTSQAVKRQIGRLLGWGLDGAVASIEQSIEAGWKGLFEPKGDAKPLKKDRFHEGFTRRAEEQAAERQADYKAALAEDERRKAARPG